MMALRLAAWALLLREGVSAGGGCCFWPEGGDRCEVGCESIASSDNYCAGGVDECNVDCGAVWGVAV